jgi:signal transduction histidine kinase
MILSTGDSWKIPWKLILIFFLLSAGILVLGYLYYGQQAAHFQRETEAQLNAIANLKVRQIVAWREERLYDAGFIFNDPVFASEVQEWLDRKEPPELKDEIFYHMQGLKQKLYVSIRLLDSAGTVRLAIPETKKEVTPQLKEIAQEALSSGKVIFTDLHLDPEKQIRLDLVVPLFFHRDGKKNIAGVIICSVNPEQVLYPIIQSWPTSSSSAEFVLVRQEGNEVVFLNELRHRNDTPLTLRLTEKLLPASQAALGKEEITQGIDYRGVPVLAATRNIPDSPWFLVAKIDASEVFSPIKERFHLVTFMLVVLIATAGTGIALIWRNREVHHYREMYEAERERRDLQRFLSSQLLLIQENERRRISQELHDELGVSLMVLKFHLKSIESGLLKVKEGVRGEFQSLFPYLDGVITNVRKLSWDLSPGSLEELGLATAIKNLLGEFSQKYEVNWSPKELEEIGDSFSSLAKISIYRIFQESMTNIGRHAQASRISIKIEQQEGHVSFTVEDNGQGFDLNRVYDRERRTKGIGLATMKERARLAGGSLKIWSHPGAGTKITISIPMDQEEGNGAALSHFAG